MLKLEDFFEEQTNKKINIFEYNNQELKNNQKLVKFNNASYIVEMNDKFNLNYIHGYFYLIYQHNLDFDTLKRVFTNLYEDINLFEYNKYLVLNSLEKLDIGDHTPAIIDAETYSNTFIIYLGEINNNEVFNTTLSVLDNIFDLIIKDSNSNKFITLNNLILYKIISLINNDLHLNTLIDFETIKKLDDNLLYTGIKFIENDFNISKTSTALFLHRNTLIYRLDKIKELSNLDLKIFKDSIIFYLSVKSYLVNKN